MSVVALASAKGSPGVTTAVWGLAVLHPGVCAVVEADPDGGDLAARLGIAPEPGLASLAAAARGERALVDAGEHARSVEDVEVVAAPAPAGAAHAALASAPGLAAAIAAWGTKRAVLVDLGRLRPGSPSFSLLEVVEAVVVLARPRAGDLAHVPALARLLDDHQVTASLALVEEGPYGADEVAEALGLRVLATVAEDHRSAAALAGAPASWRGLRRLPFLRSLRSLGESLRPLLERRVPTSEPPPVSPVVPTPPPTLPPGAPPAGPVGPAGAPVARGPVATGRVPPHRRSRFPSNPGTEPAGPDRERVR